VCVYNYIYLYKFIYVFIYLYIHSYEKIFYRALVYCLFHDEFSSLITSNNSFFYLNIMSNIMMNSNRLTFIINNKSWFMHLRTCMRISRVIRRSRWFAMWAHDGATDITGSLSLSLQALPIIFNSRRVVPVCQFFREHQASFTCRHRARQRSHHWEGTRKSRLSGRLPHICHSDEKKSIAGSPGRNQSQKLIEVGRYNFLSATTLATIAVSFQPL